MKAPQQTAVNDDAIEIQRIDHRHQREAGQRDEEHRLRAGPGRGREKERQREEERFLMQALQHIAHESRRMTQPATALGELQPLRLEHRDQPRQRSEEHTSELQSLMRISYAVFCLKKKHNTKKAPYN